LLTTRGLLTEKAKAGGATVDRLLMLLVEVRGALLASRDARLVVLRESLRGDMRGSAAAAAAEPAPAPAALRRGDTAASSGTAARLPLLLPLARSLGEGAAALACSLLLVRERMGGTAAAAAAELLKSLLLALSLGERSRGLETVAPAEAPESAEGPGVKEEPLSCCLPPPPPFFPDPPSASLFRPVTADLAASALLRRLEMAA
jgi:hypothetical protein